MSDRKHSTTGFWVTVALLAVLVGYPLSFGPAFWAISHTKMKADFLNLAYRPLFRIWESLEPDSPAGEWFTWYANLGMNERRGFIARLTKDRTTYFCLP